MIIPALTLLALTQVGPLPVREKVGTHMNKVFAFEWDGRSARGGVHPARVATIVFRYREPGDGPRHVVEISMGVPPGVTVKVPFSDALKGVPPGPWDLDVRLIDATANAGSYSAPDLLIEVVVLNPRPSGVKDLRIEDP